MTTPVYISVDFESYYTKDYGLKSMTTWSYVNDPRFDAYLVGIHGETLRYAGPPKGFDWTQVHGAYLLMHNVGFDGLVFQRLQTLGIIPKSVVPAGFIDTADMAAYLKVQRNLKHAAKYLLGIEVSKDVRDKMKGKTYAQAVALGWGPDLEKYVARDCELNYLLWQKCNKDWPEREQRLSRLSREACWRGVPVNKERAKAALESLQKQFHAAECAIPWIDEGEKPLSPKAVRAQGRRDNIPVPASFDQRLGEVEEWEDKYAEQFPWVSAFRDYRRLNTLLKKVKTLYNDIRDDGTFPCGMKYFGAATGRFSGDDKFNMQNLPKDELFGVDLRSLIEAPDGFVLMTVDASQIEARLLQWRVGNTKLLDQVRNGHHLYEAYAISTGAWKPEDGSLKEKNPKLYALKKAQVLGCGYQCGGSKFKALAATYKVFLSDDEATEAVQNFRQNNPRITAHWRRHQAWLEFSANHGDKTHEIQLASGRWLTYFNPKREPSVGFVAEFVRGANRRKLYGGLLTENEIQATARDAFILDGWLACDDIGYRPLFSVHDEFVFVIKDTPEERKKAETEVVSALREAPRSWLKDCPLDFSVNFCKRYEKD